MARCQFFLCQLCHRLVVYGESHTCFVFKNTDDVDKLPLLEEPNKSNKNHDDGKDKIADNSIKISLNLIPEASQKEKSEVSRMPDSQKIQVSSLVNISNEECDTTLEERKLKSLNNDKETFMISLNNVSEQVHSDNKIISETSNLNASSDFLCVNKEPYNYNMIQEYRYEQNSSEGVSETDDKIEEITTNRNESMYSKKNGAAMSGSSEMRTSKKRCRGKFCSKKFIRKSNFKNKNKDLMDDENAVAGPSGIGTHKKTFQVHMNPKKFISKKTKEERHKTSTSEKSFVCETCQRQFSRKDNLKTHNRIHTGERPFVCDECGKAFADKSNFTVHIRTHTGEKPYKCSVCEKAFTTSSNRNKHERTVHKNI